MESEDSLWIWEKEKKTALVDNTVAKKYGVGEVHEKIKSKLRPKRQNHSYLC